MKACLALELFCLLGYRFAKIYDLPTAIFFALGLGLMARGKWREYFTVFFLGCLNRETMILLTLVFAVYFFRRMQTRTWLFGICAQALIFVDVRVMVMRLFANSPGSVLWFRPLENVEKFAAQPWLSVLHWGGFALVLWLCLRNWNRKPLLLRTAFAVLMPILLVLYVFLGNAFELRVFAEVFPVAWVLAVEVAVSEIGFQPVPDDLT